LAIRYSFARSEAESTPRLVKVHAGQVQELAPRAAAGDQSDGAARHPEHLGEVLEELVVGAALRRGSREADAETPVGDLADLAAARARCDPDGETQAAARFGERPAFTT
jgi:hypothetical protein